MIDVLHRTLVLDEALMLAGCIVLVVRPRSAAWLSPAAWALQVLLLAQCLVGLTRIGTLSRPGLFAAYLVASLVLLPLAGALSRHTDVRLVAVRLGAAAALALVLQARLADLWAQRAG